ncbi:MAG: hypothetical protein QXS54_09910 [Candidatus Methanomethylicaceae archaeon]
MGIKDRLRRLEKIFRQNAKIEVIVVRRRENDESDEYMLSNDQKISRDELEKLVEEKRSRGIDVRVIEVVLCSANKPSPS